MEEPKVIIEVRMSPELQATLNNLVAFMGILRERIEKLEAHVTGIGQS